MYGLPLIQEYCDVIFTAAKCGMMRARYVPGSHAQLAKVNANKTPGSFPDIVAMQCSQDLEF
jgi:hypothetical protein